MVVFYGDKANWFACYAFWIFQLFGHDRAKVMNGGRKKWIDEGRPLTKEVPRYPRASYRAREQNLEIRAFRDQVLHHIGRGRWSTSGPRRSTRVSCSTWRAIRRRGRSEAVTFRPRSKPRAAL
jgi:hypothetical protein